jgi:hypothetical protein
LPANRRATVEETAGALTGVYSSGELTSCARTGPPDRCVDLPMPDRRDYVDACSWPRVVSRKDEGLGL